MVIIALLTGLVLGIYHYAQQAALRGKTRSQLERMHNALMEYNMKYGKYPGEADWYTKIKPFLPEIIGSNDAWRHPIIYKLDPNNSATYSLYSWGAQTNEDVNVTTADDIYTGR